MTTVQAFQAYRQRMNEKILGSGHLGIQRFFNLDTACYRDGALDARTKELLGLVASCVLRCDDCITYHLVRCVQLGFTDPELYEALDVALVVGGSIFIPHMRRAFEVIEELRELQAAGALPEG